MDKVPPLASRIVSINDLPLRDRDAPEIFGDLCANVHCFNGNITFTLVTCRVNLVSPLEGPAERVVSGRVVLPLAAVADLHHQLGQVLQNIRQQQQQQQILHSMRTAPPN